MIEIPTEVFDLDMEYIEEDEFDEFCFGLPEEAYLELIGKDVF